MFFGKSSVRVFRKGFVQCFPESFHRKLKAHVKIYKKPTFNEMLNEKAVAFRLLFLVYRPNYI